MRHHTPSASPWIAYPSPGAWRVDESCKDMVVSIDKGPLETAIYCSSSFRSCLETAKKCVTQSPAAKGVIGLANHKSQAAKVVALTSREVYVDQGQSIRCCSRFLQSAEQLCRWSFFCSPPRFGCFGIYYEGGPHLFGDIPA